MKNKFRLWLNIATICLCVCAIAIGVYAATSATLTISGQIGFQAHDCSVEVSITKTGYATNAELTEYEDEVVNVDMDTDTNGVQTTGIVAGNSGEGTISTVNLQALNFTDLVGNEIPDIVLTLTITNKSSYKVAATVTVEELKNLAYDREYSMGRTLNASKDRSDHSSAIILDAATSQTTANQGINESVTFTISLRVADPDEPIDSIANNLQINTMLTKYDANAIEAKGDELDDTQKIKYTLNADKASYSVVANGDPVNVDVKPFVNNLPVTTVPGSAFLAKSTLRTISFPNTLTHMAYYLFTSGLTSISIPSSILRMDINSLPLTNLTYYQENNQNYLGNPINKYLVMLTVNDKTQTSYTINPRTRVLYQTFNGCKSLTNIAIPKGVVYIGSAAFQSCSNLNKVTLSNTVRYIGWYAFNGCTQLKNIEMSDNLIGIVDGNNFDNCQSLTEIRIPSKFEFETNTSNTATFNTCTALTTVYIDSQSAFDSTIRTISKTKIFDKANMTVYIQEDVNIGENNFTKLGNDVYTENGINYLKYTENY